MFNEFARRNQIALPLASLVYQHFIQTVSAGYAATDDCNTLHMYLFGKVSIGSLSSRVSHSTKTQPKLKAATIVDLLIGIHAAVAMEVLRFARWLEIDITILESVVNDAAGSSKMFGKISPQFQMDSEVTLKGIDESGSIRSKLVSLLQPSVVQSKSNRLTAVSLRRSTNFELPPVSFIGSTAAVSRTMKRIISLLMIG